MTTRALFLGGLATVAAQSTTCTEVKNLFQDSGCCSNASGTIPAQITLVDAPGACQISEEALRIGLVDVLNSVRNAEERNTQLSESEKQNQRYAHSLRQYQSDPLAYFMANFSSSRSFFPGGIDFTDFDAGLRGMQTASGDIDPLKKAAYYYIKTEEAGGVDKSLLTVEEARGYNYLRELAFNGWQGAASFVHNTHMFCSLNAGLWNHPANLELPTAIRSTVSDAKTFIDSASRFEAAADKVLSMAKRRFTECAKYGFPLPARATAAMIGFTGRGYNLQSRIKPQTDSFAESLINYPEMDASELAKADTMAVSYGYANATAMFVGESKKLYKLKRDYVEWWKANINHLVAPEEEAVVPMAKPNTHQYKNCIPEVADLDNSDLYYGAESDTCSGRFKALKAIGCVKDETKPTKFAELVEKVESVFPGTSDVMTHANFNQVFIDRKLESFTDYSLGMQNWYDLIVSLNSTYQRTYYDKLAAAVGTDVDLMDRANDAQFCSALEQLDEVEPSASVKTFQPWPEGCRPYDGDSIVNNSKCPFFVPECNASAYYASNRDPSVCADPSALVLREKDFTVCPGILPDGDWDPSDGAEGSNSIVSPYERLPGKCDALYAVWNFLGKQLAPFGTFFADMVKNFFYNRGPKTTVSACPSGIFPNFGANWYSYSRSRSSVEDATPNDNDYYRCDIGAYGSYDVQDMLGQKDYRGKVQTFIHEQTIGHSLQIELFRDISYNNPKFGRDAPCGYLMADGSSAVYEGFASYADGFMAFEYGNLGALFGPSSQIDVSRDTINTAFNAYADIAVPSGRDTFDEAVLKFNYAQYPHLVRCPEKPEDPIACHRPTKAFPQHSSTYTYFTNRAHYLPYQMSSYIMGFANSVGLHEKWRPLCGEKWDIREFHYALNKDGSLPLDITTANTEAYLEQLCGVSAQTSGSSSTQKVMSTSTAGTKAVVKTAAPARKPLSKRGDSGMRFAKED